MRRRGPAMSRPRERLVKPCDLCDEDMASVCASCMERQRAIVRRSECVRCPSCGDRGDAKHIAACCAITIDKSMSAGASHLLVVVRKQINRRGGVDVRRLAGIVARMLGSES